MELSKKDRLILYNQYEILKLLSQEDQYNVDQCQYFQEILLNGYKRNYDEMVEWVMDDIPDSVSDFVWNVLQMHSVLLVSYNRLSPDEKNDIELDKIIFRGFDGNEEGAYYGYCLFILEKMKRYSDIYNNGGKDFNTHWPVLDKYHQMLNTWNRIKENDYKPLTKDQLLQVIKSY